MSNCKDIKEAEVDYQIHEFFKKQRAEHGIESFYEFGIEDLPWYEKVTQSLKDKFDDEEVISQKDLGKTLRKFTNSKEEYERGLILINLMGILKNATLLRDSLWLDINQKVITGRQISKTFRTVDKEIRGEIWQVPVLSELPLGTLKNIYVEALSWVTSGSKMRLGSGMFGTMQLELLTPRSVEKRESTGSIRLAREAVENYSDRATSWTYHYWESDKSERIDLDRKVSSSMGFRQLLQFIDELKDLGNTSIDEDTIFYILSGYPKGRVKIDKESGAVTASNKWENTGEFYEDGNPIYDWTDFTPLLFEGDQVILDPLSPYMGADSTLDRFLKLNDLIQNRLNRVGKMARRELTRMNKEYVRVMKSLKNSDIPKEIIDDLSGNYIQDINSGGFNNIDEVNELVAKGHFFPVIYLIAEVPFMFDSVIREMNAKKSALETDYRASTDRDERAELKNKILNIEKSLVFANGSRDLLDGMYEDPILEQKIQTQHTVKHFKEISGMMDIANMRTDRYVIEDYLDSLGKELEKNRVTLEVLKALAKAKSDGVRDYILNLYKTTFNYPDSKSTFMGIPTDLATIDNAFKGIGVTLPMETLHVMTKSLGAFIIFNLLNSPITALRNKSALFNKVHDVGFNVVMDAYTEYRKNRHIWEERAERAGVVNFVRYLEGFVAHKARPREKEAAKEAIKAAKLLSKSKMSASDVKRYKNRISKLRLGNMEGAFSQMAQWALTREPIKGRKSYIGKKWESFVNVPSAALRALPTMQDTEAFVRTISFIIGSKQAVEKGFAQHYNDVHAIKYAREYVYLSDHLLSQQGMGYFNRNAMGSLAGKLKIWSMQRMGREFRIMREALRAGASFELENDALVMKKKYKGAWGMMKALNPFWGGMPFFQSRKRKRIKGENPELAAFRSFISIHAPATLLVDFVLFAPGAKGLWGLGKSLFYNNNLARASTGLSSDLLSLVFGLVHLLWAFAAGEVDEDEFDDRTFSKFLRHTHLGVVPIMVAEALMSLAIDYDRRSKRYKKDRLSKHGRNAITPIIPGGNSTMQAIEGIKRVVD